MMNFKYRIAKAGGSIGGLRSVDKRYNVSEELFYSIMEGKVSQVNPKSNIKEDELKMIKKYLFDKLNPKGKSSIFIEDMFFEIEITK